MAIVDNMVAAGKKADEIAPGLRERDGNAWMQLAAGIAKFLFGPDYGRKSTTPDGRISPDTMACRTGPDTMYAASIIRDAEGFPWRPAPLVYERVVGHAFHEVPAVPMEDGGIIVPPPPGDLEARVAALEAWARSVQVLAYKG